MIVYTGDTRSRKFLAEMRTRRAGIMVVRGRLKARHTVVRWAFDNGAFEDYTHGRTFDENAWVRDLDVIAALPTREAPDFCVLPDIVMGGERSLELSLSYLHQVRRVHWNWYLAVQDGMTADMLDLANKPDHLAGIFIGGSLPWKLRTADYWREVTRKHGLLLHVGRIGTVKRVRAMRDLGVTSIDSCLPLWSLAQWNKFWAEVDKRQLTLAGSAGHWDRWKS